MIEIHGTKVAVVPIFDSDKTESGLLYVPEMAKQRCTQGIVRYVGKDVELVQPGDYVVFSGYTGSALMIEGEGTLLIMNEEFIVAKLEGENLTNTDIPGLYFRDREGNYWTATYEFATDLIAKAFVDAPWRHSRIGTATKESRPKEF